MNKLPPSTVKLISSTQVITSIYSVVKELVENSLDAGSDSIDVKLEKNGLAKIEIQDNGSGVSTSDVEFLCKPHYTSKIKDDSDLLNLSSYGFRGEAVHSLCTVAEITVTTKTKDDFVSQMYVFNKEGNVSEQKPTHHNIGTIISVGNLFKNIPVRRQLYNKPKKLKEELNRVEELLMSYGLIHPKLRLTLKNDKNLIWRKNRTSDYVYAISEILGKTVQDNFTELNTIEENFEVKLFVPKQNCNIEVMTRGLADRVFMFVNDRPVIIKQIKTVLKRCFNASHSLGNNRWPVAIMYIKVKPGFVDVNLEPNKTNVLLLNMEEIVEKIRSMLESLYQKSQSEPDLLLGEETTHNSEKCMNAPVHNRNHTNNKNTTLPVIEDTITNAIITETNSLSTQELLDDFFIDTDPVNHIDNRISQPANHIDDQILQPANHIDDQITQPANHIDKRTSQSSDQIKNRIYQPAEPGQDGVVTTGLIDEQLVQNHDAQNNLSKPKAGINYSTVGEVDMEVWSRGDIDICTPVKVLQPQDQNKDQSIKKRKQSDDGPPTTKKARRNSSVPRLLNGQKKLLEAGLKVKRSNNYEDESCTFQFKHVQEKYTNKKTESSITKTIRVVGKIQGTSLWSIVIGHKLFIVDNARLTEKLIYEKLARSHKFKTEKLEHPLLLTRENLGVDNFECLYEMKKELSIDDGIGRAISYPPLTENGILIKRSTDTKTGEDILEWSHSASKIPNYNMNDLIEILEETKLESENYRPKKVKEWCKKEARRLSQVSPEVCSSGEIQESILELKNHCKSDFEVALCVHNRSIMVPVKSVNFL